MAFPKPLRWILRTTAGLGILLVLLLVTLALVRITIDLEGQKGAVQKVASHALGREVVIEGSLKVSTSLRPVFIIEGVRIGNPAGFAEGDFLRMASARLEAAVLPLLKGRIHVVDCDITGLELALRVDDQKRTNWIYDPPAPPTDRPSDAPPETSAPETPPPKPASDVFELERFHLEGLAVTFQTPDMDQPTRMVVEKCDGLARAGQPLKLSFNGTLRDEPFQTKLQAVSLKELIEKNQTWMAIETAVAGATIRLEGHIDLSRIHRAYRLGALIKGRRLERFNRLTGLDLPPVSQYGLEARLVAHKKIVTLEKFRVFVGSSKLAGKAVFNAAAKPHEIRLDLKSPLVQIDDFDFPEWSLRQDVGTAAETAAATENQPDDRTTRAQVMGLLSPDVLARFNGYLTVTAQKVQSGHDMLGRGRLTASVVDGRIAIEPLELDLPGGAIAINMSLKPGRENTHAGIKIKSENFDIGVLARRYDPQATMGGSLNLDINLASLASRPRDLLANGNGYFDFSANPENLQAGIIDLWAVNLITGVLSRADKGQSQVQCLRGRFSMKDGLLESDAFVIDTSQMRICGKGRADFKKEEVALKVKPTPKQPEFFNLATPLEVHGNFSDFEVGVEKGGVAGTTVRFITSPIHVPLRRVFSSPLPEDGRDICHLPIGPHDRPTARLPGCRY